MLLKYNINNIRREQRILDIIPEKTEITEINDGNCFVITFTTKTPHNLNVGDVIVFVREIKENNSVIKLTSFEDKLFITPYNFSKKTFSLSYKKYKELYVSETFKGNDFVCVKLSEKLPLYLKKGDAFSLYKRYYSYKEKEIWNVDEKQIEIDFNPEGITEYMGYDNVKFNNSVYGWESTLLEYKCNYVNEFFFTTSNESNTISNNDLLEIEDTRFINKDGSLYEDILIYEYSEHLNFSLPISKNITTGLNDEDIAKAYFKEKKDELIPGIIDYEKKCFTPVYKNENKLNYVSKINFNLFFRDRTENKEWNTNDTKGWFQYKMDENGNFVKEEKITNGDLISVLNFTDEDVYYRKKKISKSFLRLSFYDTNNPLNQMLLFYSTIFLDSGELYTKYIKNIEKKIENPDLSLVNYKDLEDNLTVSFNVVDRNNRKKSSEGFYLYLFPDKLNNDKEKTIYMKAEFNHAGYGKTIPLIHPNNGVKCLTFDDKDSFPTSLINEENGSLKEFYRQLYIPLTVKYDDVLNDYVYYFNIAKRDNKEIIMNLYEPKINPLN